MHPSVTKIQCGGIQRPRFVFADRSPDGEADLIIGADGVRSIARKTITGDSKQDHCPAVFEGLVGIGGLIPATYLPKSYPQVTSR